MKNMLIVMMLCLSLNGVLFAGEQVPDVVEKMDLKKAVVEGATIYYEPALEGKLAAFQKVYADYRGRMADRKEPELIAHVAHEELAGKKTPVIEDIYAIVGVTDEKLKERLVEVYDGFLNLGSTISMPLVGSDNIIYLMLQSTTKDYLRNGGTLPNLTYDKATDSAEYKLYFTEDTDNASNQEILFPVASADEVEQFAQMVFTILPDQMDSVIGKSGFIIIHEVAEAAIIGRMKSNDPYKRWFTDGFANAVTYEITMRHFSKNQANDFLEQYSTEPYQNIKNQTDLQYWMSAQFNFLNQWPIEKEKDLNYARYSFATQEARRIVGLYGVECVKKILDTYATNGKKQPGALLTAIREATGDDIHKSLMQYQNYESTEEGLLRYQKAYDTAMAEKNTQDMIFCMLRMLDLHGKQPLDEDSMNLRMNIAELLYLTGYKESANASITEFANWVCSSDRPENHLAGQHLVILYALRVNQPQIAADYARKTLEGQPNDVYALAIMMRIAMQENNMEEATELAQNICKIEPNQENICHQMAKSLLAILKGK